MNVVISALMFWFCVAVWYSLDWPEWTLIFPAGVMVGMVIVPIRW